MARWVRVLALTLIISVSTIRVASISGSESYDNYEVEKEKLKNLLSKERNSKSFLSKRDDLSSGAVGIRFLNQPPLDVENLLPMDNLISDSLNAEELKYMNEWMIHITGGIQVAKTVVEELGYRFIDAVHGFEDIYVISHKLGHHNSKREAENVTNHIKSHMKVIWAEQQVARMRAKRYSFYSDNDKRNLKLVNENKETLATVMDNHKVENMFNDELWPHQWYLFDTRTRKDLPELDLHVIPVWESGVTGKGVRILVVDDGIEWTHEDLKNSYDPSISYDLNDDDFDPSPRLDSLGTNSHGTKCAGEIVMQPNNTKCGVGVAFGAKIGGIRALDGDITDRIEGTSLARNLVDVDIVSCSWGPLDDGKSVEGPGRLTILAFQLGVLEGRKGKGIVYVWASGNGGINEDNCNCDGYSSSIYTISIGSASESGEAPWYGEHCSSTLTSAYSSGGYSDQKITTTDLRNKCTGDFTGTSAATPLGAGVIALALEVNPNLTWRDVQHAIVLTSDWEILSHDPGWKINSRNLHFNNKMGFGLLNAERLVNKVREWKNVPSKVVVGVDAVLSSSKINLTSRTINEFDIDVQFKNREEKIVFLEHVEVVITLEHSRRGVLKITLTSPSGTSTDILTARPNDSSMEGFHRWSLMSVHTWGEDPLGLWKVAIQDTSESGERGRLNELSLVLHGTTTVPEMFII